MINKIVVTNATTFQAALTAAATNNTSLISIEIPGNNADTSINVTNPFVLPSTLGNSNQKLIIEGNGVTFIPVGNFTGAMIIRKNPSFDNVDCSFVIKDIHFNGNTNSCTGVELCNASDIIIENCNFSNSSFGLILRNITNGVVNNCQAVGISARGYSVDINTSSTITKSGCKNITFNQCRFNNTRNEALSVATAFFIKGGAQTVINECISRGSANTHIRFDSGGMDSNGNSYVTNFNVNNFTFDGTNDDTPAIYLSLSEGFAKLSGLYTSDPGVIVYAENTVGTATLPHLYVENIPYLNGQAKFQTTGGISLSCPTVLVRSVVWSFNEIYQGNNIFGAGRWVNDLIPYYRYAEFFDDSKKITTNSITVNGNPI